MKRRHMMGLVLAFCCTLAITEGAATAGTVSVYNVRDYGATGLGVVSDRIAIQDAIDAAALGVPGPFGGRLYGGTVYFPPGTYKIDQSLIVRKSGITLSGNLGGTLGSDAFGAVIDPQGIFAIAVAGDAAPCGSNVPSPTVLYSVRIENLYFTGIHQPVGGTTICATHVNTFSISNVIILQPYNGIHVHDFNGVTMDRIYISFPQTTFGVWLSAGGVNGVPEPTDNQHKSDIADLENVVITGIIGAAHSVIIDGAVSTVSGRKVYSIASRGVGLYVTNNVGATRVPQFITMYGFEADYPMLEGIRLETGGKYFFTDTQIHGSHTSHNIAIYSAVTSASFIGGFSDSACGAGLDTYGRGVTVQGMDFSFNSEGTAADLLCMVAAATWSGLVVESGSQMTIINGNKFDGATQKYGIIVASAASQFAVTGNVIVNPLTGSILNSAGAAGLVGNNYCSKAPCG